MTLPQNSALRYAIVGVGTNATLYVVFVGLHWAGTPPAVTAAICYVLGLTLSYVINRAWSFQSEASHRRDLPRFLFAYAIGFATTVGLIVLLTRWMPAELAQILNIGLTAMVIYLSLKITGFGKGKAGPDADRA